jgi:hypothetical protein
MRERLINAASGHHVATKKKAHEESKRQFLRLVGRVTPVRAGTRDFQAARESLWRLTPKTFASWEPAPERRSNGAKSRLSAFRVIGLIVPTCYLYKPRSPSKGTGRRGRVTRLSPNGSIALL